MKERELKKLYQYNNAQKAFCIDIQLEDYRDAYSNWDFSPFTNRDLDDDLTEYLLECSFEIPYKYNMFINFHVINRDKDAERESKSIKGIYNFFKYEIRKLRNYRASVLRDTFAFLFIGTSLLIAGSFIDSVSTDNIAFIVAKEGLFIGGWVMIWEMFSTWFFDMRKVTRKIKHFNRLLNTKIVFDYLD